MFLLKLLLLPFRLIWFVIKLAIRIILFPLKLMTGCMKMLVIAAIIAVAAYFIYQWVT
jgi:hypothetical protein